MFDTLVKRGFQVEFHSHARAILGADFPGAVTELEAVLRDATVPIEEIIAGVELTPSNRTRDGLGQNVLAG